MVLSNPKMKDLKSSLGCDVGDGGVDSGVGVVRSGSGVGDGDDGDNDYKKNYAYKAGRWLANPPPGDDVVISGLSGMYPNSDNVYQFRDNLYNKVDMVSDDTRRWELTHPEIPQRTGKLNNIHKFDAGFFGIHYRQAESLDPMTRLFLEQAIAAIIDAGVNPIELKGTNTGVFVGISFSESEKTWFFDHLMPHNFGLTGCERSMIANRLSYFLKLKGPSVSIDTACSSSLTALENAYRAIRSGRCDQAIVGGATLCLHPFVSLQFARLGVLSADGACKAFDANGNGYARSETVSAVLLQKSKDARRIYGHIIHAKTNCDGYKEQGITFPSGQMQMQLLKEFYLECGVDPHSLSFLEAHGTGTVVGDPEEVAAIDEVFGKGRKEHLLIGSVKSNIGHTEAASGHCSITKVIIGMENGYIPPNINYKKPREGIEGLEKGRLKVVTDRHPFEDNRGLIGINSFGFGGGNCHVLLKWNTKTKKNQGLPIDNIPRLVCVSGRSLDGIQSIFTDLKSRPLDAEYVKLYQEIFSRDFKEDLYRGYTIISKDNGQIYSNIQQSKKTKKSFYLVFNDLKYWRKIAKSLYIFPNFAKTIQKIHNILTLKKLDFFQILTDDTKKFDDSFGSLLIQLAIADLLKSINCQPDGFFGTKLAQILAAYYSGALSNLDDVILIIYQLINNQKIDNKLISKINNNNDKWLGISENMDLQSLKNITGELINLEYLKKNCIIVESGKGKNVLNFNKGKIFTFGQSLVNPDKHVFEFLEILGELYLAGHHFQIFNLYPEVSYPVSRGTPMISPILKWEHSYDWFVTKYTREDTIKSQERSIGVVLKEDDWQYVGGHVIDGRILFPATAYLFLAWNSLSAIFGSSIEDMKVIFENCRFLRATNIPKDGKVEFIITIQRGSGNFEIVESSVAVVTGKILLFNDVDDQFVDLPIAPEDSESTIYMNTKDIYKELRLRGYNYKGAFRKIIRCNIEATRGLIEWNNNWVTFIDNMLQMKILQMDTRLLYVPTSIKRLIIDAKRHINYAKSFGEKPNLPVFNHQDSDIIRCGGIELRGLIASSIAHRKPLGVPVLEKYEFISNSTNLLSLEEAVRVDLQLCLENLYGIRVKVIEMIDEYSNTNLIPLSPIIVQVLGDLPLVQPEIKIFSKQSFDLPSIIVEDNNLVTESECFLIVASSVSHRPIILGQALGALKENGYILSRESDEFDPETDHIDGGQMEVLTSFKIEETNEKLVLLRKSTKFVPPLIINVRDCIKFEWMELLQQSVKNNIKNIILLNENNDINGILGFANCLRREAGGGSIKCVSIQDKKAPPFSIDNPFYKNQLKKNLFVNIFQNNEWGTYRHMLLKTIDKVNVEHCFVNATVRGDLSSLRWIQGSLTHKSNTEPETVLVHVYYAAINFRDIMTASGRINVDVVTMDRLSQECIQGFEFCGRDSTGKRVMGMIQCGANSTMVMADTYLIWDIPDEWTMEDAVTLPVVYGTVLYSFFIRCSIKKGESILIHSGTGGIGQAAISIALHQGLRVFTTVGTNAKREYLKKTFPQLTDDCIGNSRDTSFEQMIYKQTNRKGVDYVLNSLAEEKLEASIRCLAYGGNFFEIGKFDLSNDNPLQMLFFEKEANFHGIMLDQFFYGVPSIKIIIQNRLLDGIRNGSVKPLSRTVFKYNEIEQAFRYMTSGKHIGKVLISIREEEPQKVCLPSVRLYPAVPHYQCNPFKVYIILGGLGGFGLELVDWMILRGARKFVLTSRHGVRTGYQTYRIKMWLSYGTTIKIYTSDTSSKKGCEDLMKFASNIGDIHGIFNLAIVLKDAIFENQTVENFITSFIPKAYTTQYLDEVSRIYCPNLRDFVVFSSVSCGRGNTGQTNYGMANSVMEKICEKRKSENLPALAIEWGAVGDVGMVAEMQEEHQEMEIGGTLQQKISSCIQMLDVLLQDSNPPIVSSMVVAEKRSGLSGSDNILEVVASILGLRDLKSISLHSTLAELGMDSMTAVEIKQTLEREHEVFLTPQDIRNMTFARLQEIQTEREDQTFIIKKDKHPEGFEIILRLMNDEVTSKIPIIRLQNKPLEDSDSRSMPNVVFIPGIEGVAKVMEPLTANMNVIPYAMQFSFENPEETIRDMAASILKRMEPLLIKDKFFYIVGYSYGTIISLELVSMLESLGYKGVLICIDGSPDMMSKLLKRQVDIGSDDLFETSLLCHLMSIYMPLEVVLKNKERIFKAKSYEERTNIGIEILPKDTPHSPYYLKKMALGIYKRLKALMEYQPNYEKIKSKVILCKPIHVTVTDMDEDYKMSYLCENPINIQTFNGNHVTILENIDLANALNDIFYKEKPQDSNEKLLIKERIILETMEHKKIDIELKQI